MSTWTPDAVLSLAPDASAAAAAKGLARASLWAEVGRDDSALWGAIKGSGATHYRARVDLRQTAFKCSCPSRKVPCKHALALLLVFAADPAAVPIGLPPEDVAAWLASRDARAEQRTTKGAEAPPVDDATRRRRADRREARVSQGLDELASWLDDMLRLGLAVARSQPPVYWQGMAARLVDAQAPGLARSVRQLEDIARSGEGWEGRLLHAVARIELIRSAYTRRVDLPAPLVEDVRTAVGWPRNRDDVAGEPVVDDRWAVLGRAIEREDRLMVRSTWLFGRRTLRPALLVDVAVGGQGFEAAPPPGTVFEGPIGYFPAALPLRAVLRSDAGPPVADPEPIGGAPTVEAALAAFADALGVVPWIERYPLRLAAMDVVVHAGEHAGPRVAVVDRTGDRLDVVPGWGHAWQMLAVAGGHPVDVFGTWDGEFLTPLAVGTADGRWSVGDRTDGGDAPERFVA